MDERLRAVLQEVYNAKVVRSDIGCWGWRGIVTAGGYGILMVPDASTRSGFTSLLVHRLSQELHGEQIQPGKLVRHLCHNPVCSRPDHLAVGSTQDNVDDKMKAGRLGHVGSKRGALNMNAKITPHQVVLIRERYAKGTTTYKVLATEFGLGISQVARIVNRQSWQ